MFLTSDQNRLPTGQAFHPSVAMWAVAEMWGGGDVLILQFAATRRGLARVAMVEFSSAAAATLMQLESDGQIVRGAAVLSARSQKNSAQWKLEPLREIHLGATEAFDDQHPLVSFVRFTTAAGKQLSLPMGVADKHSRGRRIYPTNPARSPGTGRRKPATGAATTT
ncbi:hypothetical protein G3N95_17380 [Paraburkholderia sp. Tr-20389]|uniref:hypothetical protein n=1 Tax=Paraburkholderia sp. Tr-20389 TaxID=2703903 RepID=UPI00197D6044|nr:hypothetical protein [Paraburkholderia sp. Tr-20389]MBN3754724.1 hypothetical protein [Paraburkholderia sp. Tr-20389]